MRSWVKEFSGWGVVLPRFEAELTILSACVACVAMLLAGPARASTFDTTSIDGAVISASDTAAVGAVNNLGGGKYSVDVSEYSGAFSDYWGPIPAGNVVSTSLTAFNATAAPGIIEFQYTYGNGITTPGFGGIVLAWNSTEILVEQITGFVPISMAAGTYAGALDPSSYFIFGRDNLSFESNGNTGPNLPILFGDSGSFSLAPGSTPLPAALPLFATGLGGLGLLGWRRKRKAQSVA